jgi:hypothetical protein
MSIRSMRIQIRSDSGPQRTKDVQNGKDPVEEEL